MTDRTGAGGGGSDGSGESERTNAGENTNTNTSTNMSTDANAEMATSAEPATETGASTRHGSDDEWRSVDRLRTTLNYAVLGGLLLLAAISAVQLYLAVGRTISTFVVYEYRAPLMVAFNLAVLLLAALGISLQLRRLSGRDAEDGGGGNEG